MGFDFLGFTVRQYRVGQTHTGKNVKGKPLGFRTIITPSQTARKRHTQEIKRLLRKLQSAPQAAVIRTLNPVIRGWTDYYKGWICSQVFNTCEYFTFQQVARWEQAWHPGKSKRWLRKRYTIQVNGSLRFGMYVTDKEGNKKALSIRKHTDTLHQNYVKVRGQASPYDGNLIYWAQRLKQHPLMRSKKDNAHAVASTFTTRTSWKSITVSLPLWAERTISPTNGYTIGIVTMRKRRRIWQELPGTKPRVSITRDRTLRSCVTGNAHARFWIGGGGSNPVADHTQKVHVSNFLSKLHMLDRTQAAVFAWQQGLIHKAEK
jgi:hypothetical protein